MKREEFIRMNYDSMIYNNDGILLITTSGPFFDVDKVTDDKGLGTKEFGTAMGFSPYDHVSVKDCGNWTLIRNEKDLMEAPQKVINIILFDRIESLQARLDNV